MVFYLLPNIVPLSVRFWGWSENKREEELDRLEMQERARLGQPAYGRSDQPEWVQQAAHNNSVFSQLKFGKEALRTFPYIY